MDEKTLAAVQRWANDDLRSLNAQIEFVLREALRKSGRLPKQSTDAFDIDSIIRGYAIHSRLAMCCAEAQHIVATEVSRTGLTAPLRMRPSKMTALQTLRSGLQ